MALMDATLPYLLKLANEGFTGFAKQQGLSKAVNTCKGFVTCRAVAEELLLAEKYRNIEDVI
jgi:alanine dehydrogenase